MPIETKHPQWEASIYAWQKSRDAMGGEKIVKSKNTKYLDIPTGMLTASEAPSYGGVDTDSQHNISEYRRNHGDDRAYDPSWHPNAAYRAYLRRAKFPDISAYTVRGLIGLAMKKTYTLELPESLAYIEDNFTIGGKSLRDFYKFAISEVLQTGRLPCVVDVLGDKLVVVPYSAESNINWGFNYAVFEERRNEGEDPFSHESKTKYMLFFIDPESGVYFSDELSAGEIEYPIPEEIPTYKGKTLTRLPIVYMGSTNNDKAVDQIPIEGIVDCAIQIYRKSADLSQSQYMSCNPTLVGIGVDAEDKPTALGATVAWLISNENAKVDYPKTDTSALSHVKGDINDLFEEAANYGAHLLGTPKKGAEAAETVRLQQSASGATLAGVIDTVSSGITMLIEIMAEWAGVSGEISFEGSKEFSDITLSAQELKELREGWMAGAHSHDTYLHNIIKAGITPDGRTIEEEFELIEAVQPQPKIPAPGKVVGIK
jgi:hypothetical protein